MRTGPILTRTSRSTGAPTAPNIRRSCRFQPCVSVARYQTRSRGGGRINPALAANNIRVIPDTHGRTSHLTAAQVESTSVRLSNDPARAAEIWRAIENARTSPP